MSMGNRIAKARRDKGFTQEYVALSLGVSRQAVYKWENGMSKPDTKNLIALSQLLGVSVEHLTKGDSGQSENTYSVSADAIFKASLIPLLLLPICWMIGLFSGEYTDMVKIPLSHGVKLGVPFLMYGHSPAAITLVIISIVCLILFVLLTFIGYYIFKHQNN